MAGCREEGKSGQVKRAYVLHVSNSCFTLLQLRVGQVAMMLSARRRSAAGTRNGVKMGAMG